MDDPSTSGAGREAVQPAPEMWQNRRTGPEPFIAFGRRVKSAYLQPQKGLRARLKAFLPVSMYKYFIRMTSASRAEQKLLGLAIAEARKVNTEAWNQLGMQKAKSSPRELKSLQLACEAAQLTLDYLEGRGDSPVTAQRAAVVGILNQAADNEKAFNELEVRYNKAIEALKEVQQHEMVLEAELDAAKRKWQKLRPTLKVQIKTAVVSQCRKIYGFFVSKETDMPDSGKTTEQELAALKLLVGTLEKEFNQYQKIQIDEAVAREAYLRYGTGPHHTAKGGR